MLNIINLLGCSTTLRELLNNICLFVEEGIIMESNHQRAVPKYLKNSFIYLNKVYSISIYDLVLYNYYINYLIYRVLFRRMAYESVDKSLIYLNKSSNEVDGF